MRRRLIIGCCALLVFFTFCYRSFHHDRGAREVSLFWMPFCPYGQTAARDMLMLLDQNPSAQINFYYIANEHFEKSAVVSDAAAASTVENVSGCEQRSISKPDFGRFSSLHGSQETEEAVRHVVILKRWPQLYRNYLRLFLDDPQGTWQTRAEQAGIPSADLDGWMQASEGMRWFSENIREALKLGIRLSPTLVISGKPVPKFPSTQEDLRVALCSSGVLKDNCQGVVCESRLPCPEKLGYVGKCERGKCDYQVAPLRHDAVSAWLIIPENCVPAEGFPTGDAIKGWASYLNVTRISLADPKAQHLLRGSKLDSFPVLVVEDSVSNREWGTQCVQELNLARHGNRFIVAFDYVASPFATYAQIVRDQTGLRVNPNHYSGALLLHRMGNLEAAAKSYRLALAENAEDFRAWNNLGAILYDTHGLKQSGGAMFQHAATLDAAYQPALSNLLRFATDEKNIKMIAAAKERLGWLAIQNKRWKEAAELLLEVCKTKEWEFSARKGLAVIAVQDSRPAEALKELKRCLQLNPEPDGDFTNLLAGVYFRLGDHAKALAWYEKAIGDSNPSDQAFPNLCFLLHSTEQWKKLASVSDKAYSLYPKNSAFGFYKAEALARLNHSSQAISVLKELNQTSAEAAFRSAYELAMLYRSQKEKSAATRYARQFVQAVAIQRQPALQDECMDIGRMALGFGDNGLAAEAFEQVLRVKPSHIPAHKSLAACYEKLGRQDLSQEHLTLARQFGDEVK